MSTSPSGQRCLAADVLKTGLVLEDPLTHAVYTRAKPGVVLPPESSSPSWCFGHVGVGTACRRVYW